VRSAARVRISVRENVFCVLRILRFFSDFKKNVTTFFSE